MERGDLCYLVTRRGGVCVEALVIGLQDVHAFRSRMRVMTQWNYAYHRGSKAKPAIVCE